jgi:hypothetical protein
MATNPNGILAGKKTYIVCIVTIIGIAADYLMGNINLQNAIIGVIGASAGITFRLGMSVSFDKIATLIQDAIKIISEVKSAQPEVDKSTVINKAPVIEMKSGDNNINAEAFAKSVLEILNKNMKGDN